MYVCVVKTHAGLRQQLISACNAPSVRHLRLEHKSSCYLQITMSYFEPLISVG